MGGTTQPASIPEADRQLEAWARTVLPVGAEVSLEGPSAAPGSRLHLYLLELTGAPPLRGSRPAPHQLQLRYLVTAAGASVGESHPLLSELLFAALERDDLEVDLTPPALSLWAGLGVTPRPAFILGVPLQRERPEERAPRVRGPLELRAEPATPLVGVVLGPGEFPLAGALVEVPSLDLAARTDHRGGFRFARVPESKALVLRVRAKGEVRSFTAESKPGEAVTIRFELKEG